MRVLITGGAGYIGSVVAEQLVGAGHGADATALARQAISARRGLSAVGSWLAGGELARVVADARSEAERVRRGVLWGRPEGS